MLKFILLKSSLLVKHAAVNRRHFSLHNSIVCNAIESKLFLFIDRMHTDAKQPLFADISADTDEVQGATEIESLCFNCQKNVSDD